MTVDNQIKSIQKMDAILSAILRLDGATLNELQNEVELSRSSVHNYLQTMEGLGYVQKQESGYHVDIGLLRFGGCARKQYSLYEEGKPVIDELSHKINESCILSTWRNNSRVILYRSDGKGAIVTDVYVGKKEPFHHSASGKAIVASFDNELIETVLEQTHLTQRTSNTFTTKDELREELKKIREQGFAVNDEERIKGMRAVAAPVLDRRNNKVLGAVSIAGPVTRLDMETIMDNYSNTVKRHSEMVEVQSTYR
ncbi:IclR family transcriptional regulator [Natrialbaceae archaeon A-CW3]